MTGNRNPTIKEIALSNEQANNSNVGHVTSSPRFDTLEIYKSVVGSPENLSGIRDLLTQDPFNDTSSLGEVISNQSINSTPSAFPSATSDPEQLVIAMNGEDYSKTRKGIQSLSKTTQTAKSFTDVWNSCPRLYDFVRGRRLKGPKEDIITSNNAIVIILRKALRLQVSTQVINAIVENNKYLKNLHDNDQYPSKDLVTYLKNMPFIQDNIEIMRRIISMIKVKRLDEVYAYIICEMKKIKEDERPLFADLRKDIEVRMSKASLISDNNNRPGGK